MRVSVRGRPRPRRSATAFGAPACSFPATIANTECNRVLRQRVPCNLGEDLVQVPVPEISRQFKRKFAAWLPKIRDRFRRAANKRTGFMMAASFLELNGFDFVATEVDVVMQTLALAAGDRSEADSPGSNPTVARAERRTRSWSGPCRWRSGRHRCSPDS